MDLTTTPHARDTVFGFLDASIKTDQVFNPMLIANRDGNTMLRAIREELRRSQAFTFSVAFVTPSAIALLKQALLEFSGTGRIITSDYLNFNSPETFRELLNVPNVATYAYKEAKRGFHAKGYVFDKAESSTAIVGSSNMTDTALLRNNEWNLRFSALPTGDIVRQLKDAIRDQIANSVPITEAWVSAYELGYVAPTRHLPIPYDVSRALETRAEMLSDAPRAPATSRIEPNEMQREALAEIARVRDAGERRAIVISATGTGKTILSALDVRRVRPNRMLFVVHREQILDRAIDEFMRVLDAPRSDFGKYTGGTKQLDRKYVFATIQSISTEETLRTFPDDAFDYVLIDEVHKAGAMSYRRLIEHMKPRFLLGMTATPERTDGFNVYELFDFNVPYEIRLQKALESEMLAPFHYYGVTDYTDASGTVVDDTTSLSRLVSAERVEHLLVATQRYGQVGVAVKGLIFCGGTKEAHELSRLLNARTLRGRPLRTRALTGDDPVETRERVVEQLERGELDYILSVDIFNEGIDIPSVNQVVMLRQTQSSIVFTQQLGRGLRKNPGKDYLVVIDFIGNYDTNYLIPIALFGDTSLNKDSIRKSLLDAQEAGAISGLSSVNFDEISRERVFQSLAKTKLDSIQNLKIAFTELENRLGKNPTLLDFARFDTVDPVVMATTTVGNYWSFLFKIKKVDRAPTPNEEQLLTFVSCEFMSGKRPHELLLLEALLENESVSRTAFMRLLRKHGCFVSDRTIDALARVMSLEFFTDGEQKKYGNAPVVTYADGTFSLAPRFKKALASKGDFSAHMRDVVETGLYLSRHRYDWSKQIEIGKRYSRKDVCWLFDWMSNQQGTMYGYKVDGPSQTCPIFITYHKNDDIDASIKYQDEFLNPSTVKWFTRSRRTLNSPEVQAIVGNSIPLHVFAKKDDAEGIDFFYLGRAHASEAEQERMPGADGTSLDVVTMKLNMDVPIETNLYEYLVTNTAKSVG